MLRGMGRVLCGALDRRVWQRQRPIACATDLSGGGLKRWRLHGREDSQSCAICALPVQVGVAVGGHVFSGCRRQFRRRWRHRFGLLLYVLRCGWRESRLEALLQVFSGEMRNSFSMKPLFLLGLDAIFIVYRLTG